MKTELEDFKNAWSDKPNRDKAVAKAEAYVQANLARLSTIYGDLTLPQIVEQIDFYRNVGREDDVVEADMWLLAHYEPQQIGGEAKIVKRFRG